jgi:hypothetical protein
MRSNGIGALEILCDPDLGWLYRAYASGEELLKESSSRWC